MAPDEVTLFLSGDVMTGRGIDQIFRRSVDPVLFEPAMTSAEGYVELAERAHGPIPRGVEPAYVWGEGLDHLARLQPELRIVNLETAVTSDGRPWPGKAIHYRMHPDNVASLTVAGIHCCSLANNHVLDWSAPGLQDTLEALAAAGIASVGASVDLSAAWRPAVLQPREGVRVLVLAMATTSSGVPVDWAAGPASPGVALLPDLGAGGVSMVADALVDAVPGDLVVASVHWGGNWGYPVPQEHRRFAHRLLEAGLVGVVHGHSSHHPLGIEVHQGRLILYGCGDLINDYEGIRGHEKYRGDLGLMYLATLDPSSGSLRRLEMVPTRMRRFRLETASPREGTWLARVLSREGAPFGTSVEPGEVGHLTLNW